MVFRATQDGAPHEVAVKVLHPHLAADRTFAQRFRREARVANLLSHPNIVRVLDFGSEGRVFFIVMEHLKGQDLWALLQRERRLDAPRAVRIVVQLLEALGEAHSLGVVHRDIKPENVFITRGPDGADVVKILDFGIARMADAQQTASSSGGMPLVTSLGALLGTPEYMSPEQCNGESPGPRSDLYACGVLLYTLLTGRPPFTADNPIAVTLKHLRDAPVPPSTLRPDLDPGLERAVLTALAKDPRDRHASAAVFADALEELELTPPPWSARRNIEEAILALTTEAARATVTRAERTPTVLATMADAAAPRAPDPAPLATAEPDAPPPIAPRPRPGVPAPLAALAMVVMLAAGIALGRWSLPVSDHGTAAPAHTTR
jgi:serine/threonine-protein kinase